MHYPPKFFAYKGTIMVCLKHMVLVLHHVQISIVTSVIFSVNDLSSNSQYLDQYNLHRKLFLCIRKLISHTISALHQYRNRVFMQFFSYAHYSALIWFCSAYPLHQRFASTHYISNIDNLFTVPIITLRSGSWVEYQSIIG